MLRKNTLLKLLTICILYGLVNTSFALKDDNEKPVQIDANNATADQKNMTTVFTGNVVITRGSILVHANKGVASQNSEKENIVTLFGNPVTFLQKQDDGQLVTGQCNQFTYNSKTNLAVLTGRAKIKKGKDNISGEQITYNTQTQIYSATGLPANGVSKKQSGRVTVILDQINNGK